MASRRPERGYLVFVAVLVFLLYFYRPSAVGLVGPDEPRYAQVARNMLRFGDYFTPYLQEQPWFEKPPLHYWLVAASFRTLGVGELAARLPAGLAAAGFLILFGWLTQRLFPGEAMRYAVLILASTVGWIGFARAGTMEMLFASSLAGALAFLGLWTWQGRLAWLYAFHGLLAVSVLAKGLTGIVLAASILVVYCAVTREFGWLLRVWHPGPLMLFAVVALPWYGAMYFKHGSDFLEEFIIKQHLLRFFTSQLAHPAPWWFYGPVLLLGVFPWTPHLALLRLYGVGKDNRRIFLMAWAGVVVVFFSLSQAKLPGYLLPVLPALAMWMGDELSRAPVARFRAAGLAQAVLLPIFGLAGPLLGALGMGISRVLRSPFGPEVRGPVAAFACAGVLLGWMIWRGRRLGSTVLASGMTAVALLWVITTFAPAIDRSASARPIARAVCDKSLAIGEVRRYVRYGLDFYCDQSFQRPDATEYLLSSQTPSGAVPSQEFPEAGLTLWRRK